MKSVFFLIIAGCLFYASRQLNRKFFDETEAAVRAPQRIGQDRPDEPENDSLEDPREVAKTPKAQGKLAEARVFKHHANLCLFGSAFFIFLAVVPPALRLVARRYLPPQQEPSCDSSASSSP